MNFDNSWMVKYGSKLRKKEENFDNRCCESSQPTVKYLEYCSQDSNNVETKVKPSSVLRENVASTKRENPGLESSGSSNRRSNPLSTHPRMMSIYQKRKPSRGQNLGLQFLDDRRALNSPSTLIFMYVWFDTMMKMKEEAREMHLESVIFPALRRRF